MGLSAAWRASAAVEEKTTPFGVNFMRSQGCAAGLTKVMPSQALPLSQVLLDHSLGGDTGMVCPGQPQHVVATHAPPAHHSVLDGVGEGVAQV